MEMDSLSLPPGYRFTPTDEELVSCYLWKKVHNQQLTPSTVIDMDVYTQEPWLLNWDKNVQMKNEERSYFVKREPMTKNGNGKRPRRTLKGSTCDGGWWKANTGDIKILDKQCRQLVGYMKTLTFFTQKNAERDRKKATKTDWIMHEYRLASNDQFQEWVLCRIKHNRAMSKQKDSEEKAKEDTEGNMNGGGVALMEEQRENGFQNVQLANAPHQQQQLPPQMLEDNLLTVQELQEPLEDFYYGAYLEDRSLSDQAAPPLPEDSNFDASLEEILPPEEPQLLVEYSKYGLYV